MLEHTRRHWECLRGGRLFVTGATGFFGMWLLESFAFANKQLDLKAELVGLTRDPGAFRAKAPHLVADSSIKLHRGDVRDFEFPPGKFSHCIHAGTTSSSPVPPLEMLQTIVQGTTRTLEFAVSANVKRFLFISSGAVYGDQPSELSHVPETYSGAPDTLNPASAYGEGKRVGELLCSIFHHDYALETVIARCFAFVGPHLPLDAHFAIGNFIRDAMSGTPIHVKGDGTSCRSYLYAADLAVWLWTLLLIGPQAHAFNVGSDQSVSIRQLAGVVAERIAPSAEIRMDLEPDPSLPVRAYVPMVNRSISTLGVSVTVPLGAAISRTAAWHHSIAGNAQNTFRNP